MRERNLDFTGTWFPAETFSLPRLSQARVSAALGGGHEAVDALEAGMRVHRLLPPRSLQDDLNLNPLANDRRYRAVGQALESR